MHSDHAEGADLFPKAQIWIQKTEYDQTFDASEKKASKDSRPLPDYVAALKTLKGQGRVHLVDGDAKEILPGVTVFTGGKHTFESQYVVVNTRSGRMVVASDNVYLYENLDKHVPIAVTLDAKANAGLKLLWITCGTADGLVGVNRTFREWLDSKGVNNTYIEVPDIGHVWPFWRQNLADFAPLLFQGAK